MAAAGGRRHPGSGAAAVGLVGGFAAAGLDVGGAAVGGWCVGHWGGCGGEVLAEVVRHRGWLRPGRGWAVGVGAGRVPHDRFDNQPKRGLGAPLALVEPVPAVDTAVAGAGFAAGVAGAFDQFAGDVDAVDADGGGADEAELLGLGLAGDQGLVTLTVTPAASSAGRVRSIASSRVWSVARQRVQVSRSRKRNSICSCLVARVVVGRIMLAP